MTNVEAARVLSERAMAAWSMDPANNHRRVTLNEYIDSITVGENGAYWAARDITESTVDGWWNHIRDR